MRGATATSLLAFVVYTSVRELAADHIGDQLVDEVVERAQSQLAAASTDSALDSSALGKSAPLTASPATSLAAGARPLAVHVSAQARARSPVYKPMMPMPAVHGSSSRGQPGEAMLAVSQRASQQMKSVAAAALPRGGSTVYASAVRPVPPEKVKFSKYQGLGNDFILVDNRNSDDTLLTPEQSVALCDRNFGVGADGVIFVMKPTDGTSDYRMRIYNSDGSEPEMCGNGIRCMANYVAYLDGATAKEEYNIQTLAGLIRPVVRPDGLITVDMGEPILSPAEKIPTTLAARASDGYVVDAPLTLNGVDWKVSAVSMGNPHAIVFVDDVNNIPGGGFESIGPAMESCTDAFPARVNVEFVQVDSPSHLTMKVWERGAGPTLACGTGTCALVVAAILSGRTTEREVTVTLPGGDLVIEWRESNNRIYMTGPARLVFSGET